MGSRTEVESRILAAGRAQIDRLYRLAGLVLGNASDAEDATQEALLRAWRSAAYEFATDSEQLRAPSLIPHVLR